MVLGSINFFSKMVNNRLDNGQQLGILIAIMCEKDYQFSK